MYVRFGLILSVNHTCNLRCTYCYTGQKEHRPMCLAIGRKAIDRALASIQIGGTLELGFFGGEPLIKTSLIHSLIDHAIQKAALRAIDVSFTMTSNGTICGSCAWEIMERPDLQLSISFDGLPREHDRHRLTVMGGPTSKQVLRTIDRLVDNDRPFEVVMVVRPDNVDQLADGIMFLRGRSVRHVNPSLDLWTKWSSDDIDRLCDSVAQCASLWWQGLPECGISWFDQKALVLGRLGAAARGDDSFVASPTARCGFGAGEVAVAPSGRLYPCERLIGQDSPDQAMRLAGHVLEGDDFLNMPDAAGRNDPSCNSCPVAGTCNTTCRCSNFIRTGDTRRPDHLLCRWNEACLKHTARMLVDHRNVLQTQEVTV